MKNKISLLVILSIVLCLLGVSCKKDNNDGGLNIVTGTWSISKSNLEITEYKSGNAISENDFVTDATCKVDGEILTVKVYSSSNNKELRLVLKSVEDLESSGVSQIKSMSVDSYTESHNSLGVVYFKNNTITIIFTSARFETDYDNFLEFHGDIDFKK